MYHHRIAIMEVRQIIMDVEAENDIESIKKRALEAYFSEEGDPEVGLTYPKSVVIFPWLEQGQTPPQGSDYPSPTFVEILPTDLDSPTGEACNDDECECKSQEATVIPFPSK